MSKNDLRLKLNNALSCFDEETKNLSGSDLELANQVSNLFSAFEKAILQYVDED